MSKSHIHVDPSDLIYYQFFCRARCNYFASVAEPDLILYLQKKEE